MMGNGICWYNPVLPAAWEAKASRSFEWLSQKVKIKMWLSRLHHALVGGSLALYKRDIGFPSRILPTAQISPDNQRLLNVLRSRMWLVSHSLGHLNTWIQVMLCWRFQKVRLFYRKYITRSMLWLFIVSLTSRSHCLLQAQIKSFLYIALVLALYHSNRKETNREVGIRQQQGVTMKNLTCWSGEECGRSENSGIKRAIIVETWKTVVLGAMLTVEAQLKRFQRETILATGLESILLILWQIIWLPFATVPRTYMRLNLKVMK